MAVSDRKRPAGAVPMCSVYLRARGREPLTLRIDAGPGGRALAAGPAARATHLEREVPAWARPALQPLIHAIETATSLEGAVRGATDALLAAGCSIDRRDEPASTVRRHPAGRLSQRPARPLVDVELLGLELGARAVAKRMCPPGGAADRVERFRAAGFAAVGFGITTHGASAAPRDVVLVARDERTLTHAQRTEEALVAAAASRADDAAPVREMGPLPGDPPCCVERFVRLSARDDASLAGALLGGLDERTPFETAFTVPPFTLISHAPCSPRCVPTIAAVAVLLRAMGPAARAYYEQLARARWGIDEEGFVCRQELDDVQVGRWCRIDPADPELAELPEAAPGPTHLHWRIETFLSASGARGSAPATMGPPRED